MASVLHLHLQYRLWIAEMNADIDVLRILDDYLDLLEAKNNSDDRIKNIHNYKNRFPGLRKELDELRHEMHLVKMKLGALLNEPGEAPEDIEKAINHTFYKTRYKTFKKEFSAIKKEFKKLESVE